MGEKKGSLRITREDYEELERMTEQILYDVISSDYRKDLKVWRKIREILEKERNYKLEPGVEIKAEDLYYAISVVRGKRAYKHWTATFSFWEILRMEDDKFIYEGEPEDPVSRVIEKLLKQAGKGQT